MVWIKVSKRSGIWIPGLRTAFLDDSLLERLLLLLVSCWKASVTVSNLFGLWENFRCFIDSCRSLRCPLVWWNWKEIELCTDCNVLEIGIIFGFALVHKSFTGQITQTKALEDPKLMLFHMMIEKFLQWLSQGLACSTWWIWALHRNLDNSNCHQEDVSSDQLFSGPWYLTQRLHPCTSTNAWFRSRWWARLSNYALLFMARSKSLSVTDVNGAVECG